MKDFDYIETHDPQPPVMHRRKRESVPRNRRVIPARETSTRLELRVPMQSYLCERFSHSFGGRRHDPKFRALRAENQRRQDLCVARGNVQLSRTSGDWHPITSAEIAAVMAQ